MTRRWAIPCTALVCIVIIPLIFESYTFHLYQMREPEFFTFSGARLWVFLISQVLLGFVIGLNRSLRPAFLCAFAATAVVSLIIILYNSCNVTQCYHSGPDGFGELRLGVLFFSTTAVGLMIGSISPPETGKNRRTAILFGSLTTLFVGYFPWALLFTDYLPPESGLTILIIASTLPFLFSGAISRLFSNDRKLAFYSAAIGWIVLASLFSGLRPTSMPLVVVMLIVAMPAALAGFILASRVALITRKRHKTSVLLIGLFSIFVLGASHPLIDSPINLGPDPDGALLPQPTYYAGAYHFSEKYFSSKRVEVEVNLTQFDPGSVRDFLFAGIGAQSPNCCKDGLDYGYRSDIFFNKSGIFLAARAWETCDVNIACSGYPWALMIHHTVVRLPAESIISETIGLAIEWQPDARSVKWYHSVPAGKWKEYSQFVSPKIENPYFNLGVIPVGNPFTNPDSGKAFFYQMGISTPSETLNAPGSIAFHCPAYYDRDGSKHCVDVEAIVHGNSHWKVLWKWGVQNTRAVIETDESYVKITLS